MGLNLGIKKINPLAFISRELLMEVMDVTDTENAEQVYSQSIQENLLGRGGNMNKNARLYKEGRE